jgi:uncharacterized protein YegP (UPF0339 family)
MFKLTEGKGGKFHFTLLAKNQRVILTSETYGARAAAATGIASVKKNAGNRGAFEVRTAKNGQSYFVLIAKNGEVIGQSQMYAHRSSAYTGIKSVMANGPTAETLSE